MDETGLAILRELVEGETAGIVVDTGERVAECAYCDGDVHQQMDGRVLLVDHAPTCPIPRGREYLAALVTQPT